MSLETAARQILEGGNLRGFKEFFEANRGNIDANFQFEEGLTFPGVVVQTYYEIQSFLKQRAKKIPVDEYKGTITFLVENGSDINKRDNLGKTVCHWIVVLKVAELLATCLRLGCDATTQDNEGQTVAHVAVRHADQMALETIKMYALQPNVLDTPSTASGATPLIYAVQIGATDVVRTLLQLSVDVDLQENNKFRRSALHYALLIDNEQIFDLMLRHGAKTSVQDYLGKSVLDKVAEHGNDAYLRVVTRHTSPPGPPTAASVVQYSPVLIACKNDDYEMLCALLASGEHDALHVDNDGRGALHHCADNASERCAEAVLRVAPESVALKDCGGLTPLHLVTIANNASLVDLVLRQEQTNVHERDNEGHTCLHWAVVCGNADIVSRILSHDSGVINVGDNVGAVPLHYATQAFLNPDGSMYGPMVLEALLKYDGVDIDRADEEQRTPLLWAACLGLGGCCQLLLEHGASFSHRNDKGLTVLHCATSKGHLQIVEMLINVWSMPIDDEDNNSCTPLFYAVTLRHTRIVQFLLSKGCDLDHRDAKGRTVTHCAALKGHCDVLTLLSDAGAAVCLPNKDGDLPLHEAAEGGHVEVCRVLLARMSALGDLHFVDTRNQAGHTSLHRAAQKNHKEVCQLLLEYGADANISVDRDRDASTASALATDAATVAVIEPTSRKAATPRADSDKSLDSKVRDSSSMTRANVKSTKQTQKSSSTRPKKKAVANVEGPQREETTQTATTTNRSKTRSSRSTVTKVVPPRIAALPLSPVTPSTNRSSANNSAKSSQLTTDSGTPSSGGSITGPRAELRGHDLHAKVIRSVREFEHVRDQMRAISDQRRMEMFEGFAKSAGLTKLRVAKSSRTRKCVTVTEDRDCVLPEMRCGDAVVLTEAHGPRGDSHEQVRAAYHCDSTLSALIL